MMVRSGIGIALAVALVGSAAHAEISSKLVAVSFEACNLTIREIATKVSQAPDNIVETDILRIVRFYTRDGSVLVTCSRPDRKMVVTTNTD